MGVWVSMTGKLVATDNLPEFINLALELSLNVLVRDE